MNLQENSLYSSEEEKEEFLSDNQEMIDSLYINYFGIIGLFTLAEPTAIKKYFKSDKKLQPRNITDDNNDISLIVKLALEKDLIRSNTANKMTRLLSLLKQGSIVGSDIDPEQIKELVKEIPSSSRGSIRINTAVNMFSNSEIGLDQFTKSLYKESLKKKYTRTNSEFGRLVWNGKYTNIFKNIDISNVTTRQSAEVLSTLKDTASTVKPTGKKNIDIAKEIMQSMAGKSRKEIISVMISNGISPVTASVYHQKLKNEYSDVIPTSDEQPVQSTEIPVIEPVIPEPVETKIDTDFEEWLKDIYANADNEDNLSQLYSKYGLRTIEYLKLLVEDFINNVLKTIELDQIKDYGYLMQLIRNREYNGVKVSEYIKEHFALKHKDQTVNDVESFDSFESIGIHDINIKLKQYYIIDEFSEFNSTVEKIYSEYQDEITTAFDNFVISRLSAENMVQSEEYLRINSLKDRFERVFPSDFSLIVELSKFKGLQSLFTTRDVTDKNFIKYLTLNSVFDSRENLVKNFEKHTSYNEFFGDSNVSISTPDVINSVVFKASKEVLSKIENSTYFLNTLKSLTASDVVLEEWKDLETLSPEELFLVYIKNARYTKDHKELDKIADKLKRLFPGQFDPFKIIELDRIAALELWDNNSFFSRDTNANIIIPYVLYVCSAVDYEIFKSPDSIISTSFKLYSFVNGYETLFDIFDSIRLSLQLYFDSVNDVDFTDSRRLIDLVVYIGNISQDKKAKNLILFIYDNMIKNSSGMDLIVMKTIAGTSNIVNYFKPETYKEFWNKFSSSGNLKSEIFDDFKEYYYLEDNLKSAYESGHESYVKKTNEFLYYGGFGYRYSGYGDFFETLDNRVVGLLLSGGGTKEAYEDNLKLGQSALSETIGFVNNYEEFLSTKIGFKYFKDLLLTANPSDIEDIDVNDIMELGLTISSYGDISLSILFDNNIKGEYSKSIIERLKNDVRKTEILLKNVEQLDEQSLSNEELKSISKYFSDGIIYISDPEHPIMTIGAVLVKKLYDKDKKLASDFITNIGTLSLKSKVLEKHSKLLAFNKIMFSDVIVNSPIKPHTLPSSEKLISLLEFNNLLPVPSAEDMGSLEQTEKWAENLDVSYLEMSNVTPVKQTEEYFEKQTVEFASFNAGKHGDTALRFLEEFDVILPNNLEEFNEWVSEHPDTKIEYPMFHGTSELKASMIIRSGFKLISHHVGKNLGVSVAGKALDEGIYFTNVLDKAAQYVGDEYSRTHGTIGYIFRMKAALGEWGDNYRTGGGVDPRENDYDSGFVSPEWVVREPRGQLLVGKAYRVEIVSNSLINEFRKKHGLQENITPIKTFRTFLNESTMRKYKYTSVFAFVKGMIPISKDKSVPIREFKPEKYGDHIKLDNGQFGPEIVIYHNNKELQGAFTIQYANTFLDTELGINYLKLLNKKL